MDGSRQFYWHCPEEYQIMMRDGMKLWYKGSPPSSILHEDTKAII
jgi:hypothetical protein